LDGLRFAVKDLIDVAGRSTGCGNPIWLATHPRAVVSAVCVEQLLAAGARCVGKTITDEVAFSLLGQNHFYGTPLNPSAPDRVPGGSSSGSASAVACGLAELALGTDTGGSVRIPASNCGLWGWRPTHGAVSVAGVMPFAPSLDTVGMLASRFDVLRLGAAVLTGTEPPVAAPPRAIHILHDAFALSDAEVREALQPVVALLRELYGDIVGNSSLGELCGDQEAAAWDAWLDTYRRIQAAEAESSLSAWVADARPEFGPATQAGMEFIRSQDRSRVGDAMRRRARFSRLLQQALGPRDVLCLPTAPSVAPLKAARAFDRGGDYYRRTLSLTSVAGVARLPQVTVPAAAVAGVPIGLSLVGAPGEDLFVIQAAAQLARLSKP
jgi:amidase